MGRPQVQPFAETIFRLFDIVPATHPDFLNIMMSIARHEIVRAAVVSIVKCPFEPVPGAVL